MKEKIITIKVNGAAQGQWSHLLLELNLMKAFKSIKGNLMFACICMAIRRASGLRNVLNMRWKK